MKTRFLAVIDRKRKSPWFALGVNLMAMLAMTLVMRPSFETNDDIVFAEFGSGLRGVKTPRLVFQNYILGLVYHFLLSGYRQTALVYDCAVCSACGSFQCSDLCIYEPDERLLGLIFVFHSFVGVRL